MFWYQAKWTPSEAGPVARQVLISGKNCTLYTGSRPWLSRLGILPRPANSALINSIQNGSPRSIFWTTGECTPEHTGDEGGSGRPQTSTVTRHRVRALKRSLPG